jgi:single-strand DNA-binding protein
MSEQTINRVVLSGRLAADPELRERPEGGPVCFLRLAYTTANRTPGGPRGRLTECYVLALGAEARRIARYLYRGRGVVVQGRLEKARWEAGEGKEREGTCVVAERVQFLGAPPRGTGAQALAVGFSDDMWDAGETPLVRDPRPWKVPFVPTARATLTSPAPGAGAWALCKPSDSGAPATAPGPTQEV